MAEQQIDKNVLKNLPDILLDNLIDVDSSGVLSGQILIYDSTSNT